MRIIKFLISLFWVSVLQNSATAQSDSLPQPQFNRWSFDVSTGYGFPFAKEYIAVHFHQISQNNFTYTNSRASLGNGLLSTITTTYRIKESFGLEFGIFSNRGKEVQLESYSSLINPDIFNDDFSKVHTQGILVGFSFYERLNRFEAGLHNYFLSSFFNRGYSRERRGDANDEFITVVQNTGGIGLGFMNKLSVDYFLAEHFSIGITGFVVLHTWSPKQGEFIEKSYNGVEGASSMPDATRIFTYPETYGPSPTNPYVYTSAFTYPLHSCGAGLNLRFAF